MKISAAALQAARASIGDRDAAAWYIEPGKPTVIGYAVLSDAKQHKVPATDVQVTLLEEPITVTCMLTRVSKQENLYWITVTQGKGPVWYRWVAPDGTTHDFIAYADDDPDTANGRRATTQRMRRLQMIWRLMHRFKQPQDVADRVCHAVGNQLNFATTAFLFLGLVKKRLNSQFRVYEEILKLQERGPHDDELLKMLKEAGMNSPDERTVATVLRGALLAANRDG